VNILAYKVEFMSKNLTRNW